MDIRDLQVSSVEANTQRIETTVITSTITTPEMHKGCTALASHYSQVWENFQERGLPCFLLQRYFIKRGHKGCLRMVAGLCLNY